MLPSPETLDERFSLLSQRLRLEINKRLRMWRRDDPDVRIKMEIDRDCFDRLKSCGKEKKKCCDCQRCQEAGTSIWKELEF